MLKETVKKEETVEKEKQQEQSQSKAEEKAKDDFVKVPDKELPFR